MNRLLDGNEYGNRWKSRFLIVNGNEYQMIFDHMKLSDRNTIMNEADLKSIEPQ